MVSFENIYHGLRGWRFRSSDETRSYSKVYVLFVPCMLLPEMRLFGRHHRLAGAIQSKIETS